jgi:hypothetical protein
LKALKARQNLKKVRSQRDKQNLEIAFPLRAFCIPDKFELWALIASWDKGGSHQSLEFIKSSHQAGPSEDYNPGLWRKMEPNSFLPTSQRILRKIPLSKWSKKMGKC